MPRIFRWFRRNNNNNKNKKTDNNTVGEEENVDVKDRNDKEDKEKTDTIAVNQDNDDENNDVIENKENNDVIENKENDDAVEKKENDDETEDKENDVVIENKEPEIENKEDNVQNDDQQVDDQVKEKPKKNRYDPAKKAEVLKDELVTNYLNRKSEEKEAREAELGKRVGEEAQKPSTVGKIAGYVGKAVKATGVANDVVNTCVGVLNSGMGYKGLVQASKNKAENTPADTTPTDTTPTDTSPADTTPSDTPADDAAAAQNDQKKEKTSADKLKMGTTAVSMLTSFSGGLANVAGFGLSGMNALTAKNNRKKWSGIFGAATNAAGFFANASKFTASGLSLFGNQDKTAVSRATGWLGVAGAGAGILASSINTVGSFVDWNYRRLIINKSRSMSNSIDKNGIGALENDKKQAIKDAKKNNDWKKYKTEKTAMNDIKAQKYAMKQAADLNSVKKGQMWKGMAGVVGGIGSLTSSLAAAIPAFGNSMFGQIMKASGGAIGALTNIAKQYERVSDKNAGTKLKEKKTDVVNEYLERKKEKIDAEVKEFYHEHRDFATITPKEKNRILMARLGVDLEITDDDLSSADYDKAFELINHKRALNIMNASDEIRAKIFEALRLKPNATIADVESVLRGD